MCLLIVLRHQGPDHSLVVAGNRDELLVRPSSPPGLFVGERHRMLSPRDKVAGGTWLAVSEVGAFAGITNVAREPTRDDAPSRGRLPHLVLDHDDLATGLAALRDEVERNPPNAFQLVAADRERIAVVRFAAATLEVIDDAGEVVVITNEHRLGELTLDLAAANSLELDAEQRLDALAPLLVDAGGVGRHPILKRGELYGTVSSALIAVPRRDPRALVWRFSPGPPDVTKYRNYGNLGRRLVD